MDNTLAKKVFSHPLHMIAFGLGAGLSPKAPGTMGTLVALPLITCMAPLSLTTYTIITVLVTLFGMYAAHWSSRDLNVHDHSGIVIDEIAGMMWTMLAVPPSFLNLALGFALFRFFDIVKPWPIRWADKKVGGGFGIMLDDLLAAIYATLCLRILLHFT